MPKEQFEAFLSEVLNTVPEDRRDAIRASLTDEAIVKKLEDGFLRQSDYSREQDRLRQRQKEIDDFLAKESEKVSRWQAGWEENLRLINEKEEQLAAYRAKFGDTPGDAPVMDKNAIAAAVKAELERERATFSTWSVDAMDRMTDLKLEHREKFGAPLNMKELGEFAAKHNINDLSIAYNAFVAPQVEAKREEAFKAKMEEAIKQAREDERRKAIAERFPAAGGSRTAYAEAAKDAIIDNPVDRVRSAAQFLEEQMAALGSR